MKSNGAYLSDLARHLASVLKSHSNADETLKIVVAVSGGADSMALLAAARELSSSGQLSLTAAHLIHHPEEAEALKRAEMVRKFCLLREIPLIVDTIKINSGQVKSPEDRMREARYRFLEEVADGQSCHYILTGHHLDDQAETLLHRIIIGTGIKGLSGVRAKRGRVIRPFLSFRKSRLITYCEQMKIPFISDPSNFDLHVPRNYIRHKLLPLIERDLNPGVMDALYRLQCWASEAEEVILPQVNQCWEKSVRNFQKSEIVLDIHSILPYFTLIQKAVVLRAIESLAENSPQLSAAEIERVVGLLRRGRTGSFLQFSGNVSVARDRGSLIVFRDGAKDLQFSLITGRNQDIEEIGLQAVWEKSDFKHLHSGNGLSADMNIGTDRVKLILRAAREGDRFLALGSPGEKRLFRFLADRKVPRFQKRRTLVLERNGEIIWVLGHRIAETVRIKESSPENWLLLFNKLREK